MTFHRVGPIGIGRSLKTGERSQSTTGTIWSPGQNQHICNNLQEYERLGQCSGRLRAKWTPKGKYTLCIYSPLFWPQLLNQDVDYECREIIGAEFDDLTLRQASELIDHLKATQPANGRGNGR